MKWTDRPMEKPMLCPHCGQLHRYALTSGPDALPTPGAGEPVICGVCGGDMIRTARGFEKMTGAQLEAWFAGHPGRRVIYFEAKRALFYRMKLEGFAALQATLDRAGATLQ